VVLQILQRIRYTSDWISYDGTGDIDVNWSGKNAPGQLTVHEPRVVVLVRFHITGEIGDEFYYIECTLHPNTRAANLATLATATSGITSVATILSV
jgi:hypothetical protein